VEAAARACAAAEDGLAAAPVRHGVLDSMVGLVVGLVVGPVVGGSCGGHCGQPVHVLAHLRGEVISVEVHISHAAGQVEPATVAGWRRGECHCQVGGQLSRRHQQRICVTSALTTNGLSLSQDGK